MDWRHSVRPRDALIHGLPALAATGPGQHDHVHTVRMLLSSQLMHGSGPDVELVTGTQPRSWLAMLWSAAKQLACFSGQQGVLDAYYVRATGALWRVTFPGIAVILTGRVCHGTPMIPASFAAACQELLRAFYRDMLSVRPKVRQ